MARQPTGNPQGRPRKPTALKALHGDFKHDPQRRNPREPVPGPTPVEPPEHLSGPARKIWDQVAPDMIRTGVLTSWDVHTFAEICEAFVVARVARTNALREQAGTLTVPRGGTTPTSLWRAALYAINTGASKFGMSAADRARLATPELNENFDDLISGPLDGRVLRR